MIIVRELTGGLDHRLNRVVIFEDYAVNTMRYIIAGNPAGSPQSVSALRRRGGKN